MFNDNAELWDLVKVVNKAGNKFDLPFPKTLGVCNQILDLAKEARERGQHPDSLTNLQKAVEILKRELSDYIDFKVYDEAKDRWVTE